MLKSDERTAIFALQKRGLSVRRIARAMGISRETVAKVLESGLVEVNSRQSLPLAAIEEHPNLEQVIRELYRRCEGYVTRVVECLEKEHHIEIPYSTMARYVNTLDLRPQRASKGPSQEIITGPGIEIQHDTSPITVLLDGKPTGLHLAELIYCYSRNRYLEFFPRWQRFHLKIFFVRGLQFLGGACERAIVDNAKVIVILGAGPDGVVSLEMERFGQLFAFEWAPIFPGHKNRNGKVEKAHQFVQTNFLPGRTFRDLDDLNRQLMEWREKHVFQRPVDGQDFAPIDRWPEELAHLKPLPDYVPTISRTWSGRKVDDYGWVRLHTSRYSAPDRYVGRYLDVRETADEVILLDRSQELCRHKRYPENVSRESRLPGHRAARSRRPPSTGQSSEERHLRSLDPEVSGYLDELGARPTRYSYARLRRLYRFSCTYPLELFLSTLKEARERKAFDLNMLEKVLEEKMGTRIQESRLVSDAHLEDRPAYRLGQVTPHRLRDHPIAAETERPVEAAVKATAAQMNPVTNEGRIPHGDKPEGLAGGEPEAPQDALQRGRASDGSQGGAGQTEELHIAGSGTPGTGGGGA